MSWLRRRYRGNKVWVQVDEAGALRLDDRGLASLRYKPDDERTYTVRPDEVKPLEEAAPPPEASPAAEPIRAFTDGASSGNPGPAGLGVVLLWGGRRREIRAFLGEGTNNEAELEAIRVALEAIRREDLPVEVHTDSEYAIAVLEQTKKAKANLPLIARIREAMARFPALRFVKVRAHSGIPENERADGLARAAIRDRGPPLA
jgi:ribonuclease HI